MCQCSPCLTAGCGGCKSNKYCNLIEGKKFPRCDVYYPSFNEANVAASELPTKAQVEMRGTEPRKVESEPPVALTLFPTVFEKLDIGENCGKDGDCLSGYVFSCGCILQLSFDRPVPIYNCCHVVHFHTGPASDTVFQNWGFVNVKPVSVLVVEDVPLIISVMLLLHWYRTYVLCTHRCPHRSQVKCLQ